MISNTKRDTQWMELCPVLCHNQLHCMSTLVAVAITTGYHRNRALTTVGTMSVLLASGSSMMESKVSFSL